MPPNAKGHLWKVLQVAFGKREALILSGYSAMLGFRTFLSLAVADLDGRIVAALVARNPRRFLKGIVLWMLMALPASATNSALSYLHSYLSLALRRRLTHYLHSLYLSTDLSFYSLSALDDRITSPDHSIVSDAAAFAESFVSVYSNLAKPILDLIVYNYQLSKSVGVRGVFGMIAFIYSSALALQKMTPKFGKLTAQSQKLEAEFRSTHYRLIENAEEVAFFNGHEKEKSLLNAKFDQLKDHMYSLFRTRIWHTMLEDFIIKYVWGATGIVFLSLPVFFKKYSSEKITVSANIENRTQRFVSNKRLLLSCSDASGRIM
jgi:ATP-binding cassette subfamily D (ALD) long-chain fatty acid import protein